MTHATTHDPHPTDRRTDEYERAMRLFHERSLTAAARMLRAEDYEAPMRRLLTAEDKKIMARMEQCHYARFYSGSEENAVYRDQDEIDKYLPQELSRRAKSIRCRIPYLKDATYDEFEEATNLNRAKENFERLAAGVAGESPIAAAPGKRPGFAPLDPKERTPSTFRRRSVSELLSTEWVEPTALVTDPRGRLLIAATDPLLVHGDWRSGKTWMLLDLAISLATGLPLFDHFPVSEPKRVVYIGAEGTPGSFADRLEQLLKIRGLTHDDLGGRLALIIMSDQEADTYLTIDDPESVGDLIADLGEDTPDVLMIDPLANFMRGEETNDGMKVVVQQVRRITQASGLRSSSLTTTSRTARPTTRRPSGAAAAVPSPPEWAP